MKNKAYHTVRGEFQLGEGTYIYLTELDYVNGTKRLHNIVS
jgi:hypothetical protein